MEEAGPAIVRTGIAVLRLEFPPVVQVGVMDLDIGAHLGEFAHDHLRAAVAGVAHVFTIGRAQHQDFGGRDGLAHVTQGITHKLGRVQRAGVVNVNGQRRDLEDVILESKDVPVSPYAQSAVFGQAIAANARPRER